MTTMTRQCRYSHRCGIALGMADDGVAGASEVDANSIGCVRRNNSNGNGTGINNTRSRDHLTCLLNIDNRTCFDIVCAMLI